MIVEERPAFPEIKESFQGVAALRMESRVFTFRMCAAQGHFSPAGSAVDCGKLSTNGEVSASLCASESNRK